METFRARTTRLAIAGLTLMTLAVFGCKSTPEPEAPAPTPTGSEFSQGEAPDDDSTSAAPSSGLGTVYFDYDRAEIRGDAKIQLQANADAMGSGSGSVTIEGHCDERGDEEYNLALGERRANSVRKYLANLGVDSSRLRIVSYGEAKPAIQGHDESAWRYNRRAEFRSTR